VYDKDYMFDFAMALQKNAHLLIEGMI